MKKQALIPFVLLLLGPAWLRAAAPSDAGPAGEAKGLKVAFIGDQGAGKAARAVLRLIRKEGADMVLHQGDFDYQDDPEAWDQMISSELGPDFPYFASLGNHDVKARKGYVRKLKKRLDRVSGAACSGALADQSACSYRGLFFLLMAAGMGSGRRDSAYAEEQLARAPLGWRICSWHIPQPEMQPGIQEDKAGWEIYEACRRGGAIIATAHEHSYARTHLMEDFSLQRVASTGSILEIRPGRTFAFVSGLGGHSIRSQKRSDPWWAALYTSTQGADYGALFCTFGARRASCYFKDVQGKVPDRFELVNAAEAKP